MSNEKGTPLLIVCAVPFLRERDISRFAEGESYSDRSKRINENIRKHYEEVAALAEKVRLSLNPEIPIVATGHMSVTGGKRNEDDGVRETYIGNIEAVGIDIFPDTFDYVALGHYHIACKIKENIRYCGSPIPMGFGEASQKKCVNIIEFIEEMSIESKTIPVFQKLESIVGDKLMIEKRILELKKSEDSVWVEIIYQGDEIFPDFASWARVSIDFEIDVFVLLISFSDAAVSSMAAEIISVVSLTSSKFKLKLFISPCTCSTDSLTLSVLP